MTQTHSTGALRASYKLKQYGICDPIIFNDIARIIDRETHASEMLAFIEKVAAFSFEGNKNLYDKVTQAQAEAFRLLKKVRG